MKRTLLSLFAVVTMVAATGCEPSRETRENIVHTPETTTSTTGTTPAATTNTAETASAAILVTLNEYSIEMPATLPAGLTKFEIRNAGQLPHNFEIEGQGIEKELEEDLAPGASGTLEVDLQPGTYRIYCPVGTHDTEHGMTTQLTVN